MNWQYSTRDCYGVIFFIKLTDTQYVAGPWRDIINIVYYFMRLIFAFKHNLSSAYSLDLNPITKENSTTVFLVELAKELAMAGHTIGGTIIQVP